MPTIFLTTKNNPGSLLALLQPRQTILGQSLPPIPSWTTKDSHHTTSPIQISQSHLLSSPIHALKIQRPRWCSSYSSQKGLQNSALFLANYFSFPTPVTFSTSWKLAHVFPVPKRRQVKSIQLSSLCHHFIHL